MAVAYPLRTDFFDRAQHGRRAFSLLAFRRHPACARHCSIFTPPHYWPSIMKEKEIKTFYFGTLVILLLTGCAGHVHQMVREGDAPFVGGELVHDRGEDNRLVLEAPNRRYEARGFVVERQTNLAALRKRYYMANRKHWDRIFARLDTDHVTYSVETVAISAEKDKVLCRLIWQPRSKPEGICTDQAGTAFSVHFE